MGAVKRSSFFLVVVVFALLLLTSMAAGGRKMLINKHQVQSMETSDHETMQGQEDDEMLVMVHERILRQVKTNDYGTYDPTPTMAKPHAKEIPN
uniref:Uncharacterized protein n=1 Tax=Oryza punctata TaxID=4537 RepID=A0A0E0JGM8_ORYPU